MDPLFQHEQRGKPINLKFSAAQEAEALLAKNDQYFLMAKQFDKTRLLLEVLMQVNSLMSKGEDFEKFFIEVGKILQEKLQFTYIHIWLRNEKDHSELRLVTPEITDVYRTMSINTGIVGKTIREGRTNYVPDISKEPNYVEIHKGIKCEICIPLISDEKVIGAINIESETSGVFEDNIPLLEIIAENLSHSVKVAFLYKTEKQFHGLIEQMGEGVWVGDSSAKTIYTNPTLQKISGYGKDELQEKNILELFDEKNRQTVKQQMEQRKHGKVGHYEASVLTKEKVQIPVIIHAVPFSDGGTMATITDLRPIKSAEKRLLHAERFLASITQYCPEAILGMDENTIIQSWNISAECMFGYKSDEVIGKSAEILVPKDRIASNEINQLLQDAKNRGLVRNFETIRLHKNGTPINIALTMSAVRDDNDKIMGFSALYRDITTQKKWERELQDRFEKMQEAYREMGKQRRHLDYMIDIINMTSSPGLTIKQIAAFVVNAMVIITKVDAATMRLLDHESNKLTLVSQSGLGEEWWSKKTIPFTGSLLEDAIENGQPLKILDIISDSRYKSPALAQKNNVRSALVIPLQAKGEIMGSLTLYLAQENNLTILDDEFIMIFAKQAALALKLIK